jgi:hypothetical protein
MKIKVGNTIVSGKGDCKLLVIAPEERGQWLTLHTLSGRMAVYDERYMKKMLFRAIRRTNRVKSVTSRKTATVYMMKMHESVVKIGVTRGSVEERRRAFATCTLEMPETLATGRVQESNMFKIERDILVEMRRWYSQGAGGKETFYVDPSSISHAMSVFHNLLHR